MPHFEAAEAKRFYEEAKQIRQPYENEMRMAAAYCMPWDYGAWNTSGPAQTQGMSGLAGARRVAYDSTGVRSLPKYASILNRIGTPDNIKWHMLSANDATLRKSYRVREYFDQLNTLLFDYRYNTTAGFRIAAGEVYGQLGTYGSGPIFIGQRKPRTPAQKPGLRYVSCATRDVFWLVDDGGEVVMVFRRFWLNARQYATKFPKVPMPAAMQTAAASAPGKAPSEARMFEFVHIVAYRDQVDPNSTGVKRHPVVGCYLNIEAVEYVGEDEGYQSMPYKIPRVMTVSGNPYGVSPANLAMASLGSASAMKKTQLKQGQKAVDPVLLAHDDGVLNGEIDLRPGAVNYGGVDAQGRKRIQALDTGNFQVSELLLDAERKDIEDSFFVTLFQILTETPEMTATEVMERVAEKAALLAPTMGRIQTEFLGPLIEREIDILTELGVRPKMPPELIEAQGEYEIVYTSPMAKGMYAEEVSGFMRVTEMAMGVAGAVQDPSLLDHFDFDTALPEIADYMAVPSRWMASEDKIKTKREGRSQQMQNAELMKNAPALASAAKTVQDMEAGGGRRGRA